MKLPYETIISLFQWWNTEALSSSKCLQRLWRLIEWWNLTKSPIRKIKLYVFFETQLENRKCLEEDLIKTKYLKEINAKTDEPRNAEKQYFWVVYGHQGTRRVHSALLLWRGDNNSPTQTWKTHRKERASHKGGETEGKEVKIWKCVHAQ